MKQLTTVLNVGAENLGHKVGDHQQEGANQILTRHHPRLPASQPLNIQRIDDGRPQQFHAKKSKTY